MSAPPLVLGKLTQPELDELIMLMTTWGCDLGDPWEENYDVNKYVIKEAYRFMGDRIRERNIAMRNENPNLKDDEEERKKFIEQMDLGAGLAAKAMNT